MKILLCIIIFVICSGAGYIYKLRLKIKQQFLEYLLEFENYLSCNMTLFKNDVIEIINKFLESKKDKCEKFNLVFVQSNGVYLFDKKILLKYLKDENQVAMIDRFLKELGKNEYEFEKEKNKNFEDYIKTEIVDAKNVCDKQGSLYFKLSLALGAVLCIIIW